MSVTPTAIVKHLMASGFKDNGRRNKFTVTLYRRYDDLAYAVNDGNRLPPSCVWGIEEVREPQ